MFITSEVHCNTKDIVSFSSFNVASLTYTFVPVVEDVLVKLVSSLSLPTFTFKSEADAFLYVFPEY